MFNVLFKRFQRLWNWHFCFGCKTTNLSLWRNGKAHDYKNTILQLTVLKLSAIWTDFGDKRNTKFEERRFFIHLHESKNSMIWATETKIINAISIASFWRGSGQFSVEHSPAFNIYKRIYNKVSQYITEFLHTWWIS